MTARLPELLSSWLGQVTGLVVSATGDAVEDGAANMLVFSISDAHSAQVSAEQLDDFLMRAHRHLSATLAHKGVNWWFYAWYDEMSGTLRSSLCQASNGSQLPFECQLNVVDVPRPVSDAALGSTYSEGIPRDELVLEEEWHDDDDDDDEVYVLTVFGRPLIQAANSP